MLYEIKFSTGRVYTIPTGETLMWAGLALAITSLGVVPDFELRKIAHTQRGD